MQHVWEILDALTKCCWKSHEGKRPFGSPRNRRKYTIKMNLKEIGCGVNSSGTG
jgi:hypothetical protein